MFSVDKKHLAAGLLTVAAGLGALGLVSAKTWAQGQGTNASIIGVVTDKSGAVVPDATVTITSPALQVTQMVTKTDPGGNYKFVVLPAPGVYKLTFSATGFGTVVK